VGESPGLVGEPPTEFARDDRGARELCEFITYWMTRYYSEAAVPAVQPLPAWLGPSFA
jgi:hypothetical protein